MPCTALLLQHQSCTFILAAMKERAERTGCERGRLSMDMWVKAEVLYQTVFLNLFRSKTPLTHTPKKTFSPTFFQLHFSEKENEILVKHPWIPENTPKCFISLWPLLYHFHFAQRYFGMSSSENDVYISRVTWAGHVQKWHKRWNIVISDDYNIWIKRML